MTSPFAPYLAWLLDRHQLLRIEGIGSKPGSVGQANQFAIEELYTRLQCRTDGASRDSSEPEEALAAHAGRNAPDSDLARAFSRHRHLMIEGQPGSGKTTFLRLIAVLLARDGLGLPCPRGSSWRHAYLGLGDACRVPLLLSAHELRQQKKRGQPTCERIVDHFAELSARKETGWNLAPETWREALETDAATLLIDSLDEVAEEADRDWLLEVITDAKAHWPVVIASRPFLTDRLLSDSLARATIEDFGEPEIREFLERWVRALDGIPREQPIQGRAAERLRDLLDAILSKPPIRRLAANPVMLTCLCVIHFNETRIPEARALAYAAMMRWLLQAKDEGRRQLRFGDLELGLGWKFAQSAFRRLALAMMNPGGAKTSVTDFDRSARIIEPELQRFTPDLSLAERERCARHWLEFECIGSGIVQKIGYGELRFWHLTFQEFFAAEELVTYGDEERGSRAWWPIVRQRLEDAQWRETIDLFPTCLFDSRSERGVDLLLRRLVQSTEGFGYALLRHVEGPSRSLRREARLAGILGRVLVPLEECQYRPSPTLSRRYQQCLSHVLEIFSPQGAARVPISLREPAAEALGQAGDSRLGWKWEKNLLHIGDESGVRLGKYLVTVQEYQEFVDARGYEDAEWWGADWSWRERERWREPGDWSNQLLHRNRPVVNVSWYEAHAYCTWRSRMHDRVEVRLPRSDEWLAAASPDGRTYPWGDDDPTREHANFDASKLGHASAVGLYPSGAGKYGQLDLAGNVWEWCLDEWEERVLEKDIEKWGPAMQCRGGSWHDSADYLRAAFRNRGHAAYRVVNLGFRVAVRPASRRLDP